MKQSFALTLLLTRMHRTWIEKWVSRGWLHNVWICKKRPPVILCLLCSVLLKLWRHEQQQLLLEETLEVSHGQCYRINGPGQCTKKSGPVLTFIHSITKLDCTPQLQSFPALSLPILRYWQTNECISCHWSPSIHSWLAWYYLVLSSEWKDPHTREDRCS